MVRLMAALVVALAAAFPARADSWVTAQVREVFSASRDYFVRVTPGDSWGETVGFKGSKIGRHARAAFYRRAEDHSYRLVSEVTLANPVAPVDFFVANGGRMITFDNWHNRGYGPAVVAIYDANGRTVKAYTLADLFSETEIEAFSYSTSSIHWHDGPAYINQDQKTLYLMVKSGSDLVFGLESGRYAFCETREGKYLCRNSNTEREWRPYYMAVPKA